MHSKEIDEISEAAVIRALERYDWEYFSESPLRVALATKIGLRLLTEREAERRTFQGEEYWSISPELERNGQHFTARLALLDGDKPDLGDQALVKIILGDLTMHTHFVVTDVRHRERRKLPQSSLDGLSIGNAVDRQCGFSQRRTQRLIRALLDGVALSRTDEVTKLITYVVTWEAEAVEEEARAADEARQYVRTAFGDEFLGAFSPPGTSRELFWTAIQSIRPVHPSLTPALVRERLSPEHFELYDLVWRRFIASTMAPAVFEMTDVDFALAGSGGHYLLRSTASAMRFPGFLAFCSGDSSATIQDPHALPEMKIGDRVSVKELKAQRVTPPSSRYTASRLARAVAAELDSLEETL